MGTENLRENSRMRVAGLKKNLLRKAGVRKAGVRKAGVRKAGVRKPRWESAGCRLQWCG